MTQEQQGQETERREANGRDTQPPDCSAAYLFGLLWESLSDVLGTAATAALLRRCVRRLARRVPALERPLIERTGLAYGYLLPPAWERGEPGALPALRALVQELWPLLVELTGPIVVGRLEHIPEFGRCGLTASPGSEP